MCDRRRRRGGWQAQAVGAAALAAALLAGAAAPAQAQADITWPEELYNPQPDVDDLVLPMPCGGAMVFRRIELALGPNPLDDQLVILGSDSQEDAPFDFRLRDHLTGGFNDTVLGVRANYYFLGKYEVTRDQYAAVMTDTCPEPSAQGSQPVTEVSWFDAVAFTEAYTTWLWAEAPDTMPTEGDSRSYVRLPTETEWEFAVRGGVAVTERDFRERLFPHQGDFAQYALFQAQRSADGVLWPVGSRLPNPLNLYDMLGNAEEMMLEPYQINRFGRRHGQVGGMVTRGGSFRTLEADLRNSWRTEYSLFDESTGRARVLDTIGFRAALSVPVTVDQARQQELAQAWQAAQAREATTVQETDIDPLEALDALAEDTFDPDARQDLLAIRAALSTAFAEREEVAARALRRSISSGAVLIRTLRYDRGVMNATETALRFEQQLNAGSERADRLQRQIEAMQERYDITLRTYFDILLQAADDYSADFLQDQRDVVNIGFEQQDLPTLATFATLFVQQVLSYQETQSLEAEDYEAELLAD